MYVVSNNDLQTRHNFHEMIQSELPTIELNHVYPSSYLAAQMIKEKHPFASTVRFVGMDSIKEELENVGLKSLGG